MAAKHVDPEIVAAAADEGFKSVLKTYTELAQNVSTNMQTLTKYLQLFQLGADKTGRAAQQLIDDFNGVFVPLKTTLWWKVDELMTADYQGYTEDEKRRINLQITNLKRLYDIVNGEAPTYDAISAALLQNPEIMKIIKLIFALRNSEFGSREINGGLRNVEDPFRVGNPDAVLFIFDLLTQTDKGPNATDMPLLTMTNYTADEIKEYITFKSMPTGIRINDTEYKKWLVEYFKRSMRLKAYLDKNQEISFSGATAGIGTENPEAVKWAAHQREHLSAKLRDEEAAAAMMGLAGQAGAAGGGISDPEEKATKKLISDAMAEARRQIEAEVAAGPSSGTRSGAGGVAGIPAEARAGGGGGGAGVLAAPAEAPASRPRAGGGGAGGGRTPPAPVRPISSKRPAAPVDEVPLKAVKPGRSGEEEGSMLEGGAKRKTKKSTKSKKSKKSKKASKTKKAKKSKKH